MTTDETSPEWNLPTAGFSFGIVWGMVALLSSASVLADTPQAIHTLNIPTPMASPAAELTIQDAIKQALNQNPVMQQSQAAISQARGAIQEANGHLLPQLDLTVGAMASNNALNVFGMKLNQGNANFNDFGVQQFFANAGPNFGNLAGASSTPPDELNHPGWYHNFQTSLKLSIPIYNGGKIRAMRRQAEAYLQAAQSGDIAARQHLILQVVQAYAGIDAATAFVEVTREAVDAAQSYLNLSDRLYKQGVVSKSDLLHAQVNLGDIQLRHQQALDQRANANDGLRVILGMDASKPFTVDELIKIASPSGTLAEARSLALDHNPQIQALTQQIDAARSGVSAARSIYKPQFNLVAQQDWNSHNPGLKNDSYTVGGVMSWNLLDFGARSGQVDRAVAGLSAAQAQQQIALNQLLIQVGEVWRAARLADQRLQVKQLAIGQNDEAVRLEKLRYAQGLSTMTNLLQTQAELDKARAEFVQAQYELVLQRANLLLATGQLEPEAIGAVPLHETNASNPSLKVSSRHARH